MLNILLDSYSICYLVSVHIKLSLPRLRSCGGSPEDTGAVHFNQGSGAAALAEGLQFGRGPTAPNSGPGDFHSHRGRLVHMTIVISRFLLDVLTQCVTCG